MAGQSFGGASEFAMDLAKKEGRTIVHAFNDPMIVAGQGVSPSFFLFFPFIHAFIHSFIHAFIHSNVVM
jgi:hypothetical protein